MRAIKYLIDKMLVSDKAYLYAATEYFDDVYFKSVEGEDISEIAEGDKNYKSVKGFTFMSDEIKNSLIVFLDCWFLNSSEYLTFCYYTNVDISKERNSEHIKDLGIELPKEPIIKMIINKSYTTDKDLLEIIKTVLIVEYEKQYSGKEQSGYLEQIKIMPNELWIDFLNKIDWKFNEENESELKATLMQDIAKFSNEKRDLLGKEAYVIAALLDELEQRQNSKDLMSRFITDSIVKLVMLEIATNQRRTSDPIFKSWNELEATDKRNLNEKILSVCSSFDEKLISIYSRKVGNTRIEYSKILAEDKGAYQFRIYDICDENLYKILRKAKETEITEEMVESWIEELKECAEEHIDEMSKDYSYPFKNKKSIEGAILELFDSCYLSFDSEGLNE
ncbi:hypothetical protein [Peribacillus butanolivorans]|uniref:hypothetical protein n=1 Tax=Peribacillus butanolivorans TaxID=421767 RepID=UPI0039FD4417